MGESPQRQYALAVVCTVLPTLFVVFRFLARRKTKGRYYWDDWLIGFALLACIATAALLVVDTAIGGLGRPMERDARGRVIRNMKLYSNHQKALFGNMLTQILSIGPTKVSVLLFYRRIFAKNGTRWFDITSMIMIFIAIGWTVSFFFSNLFECGVEMHQLWALKPKPPKHCVHPLNMYLAQSYADAATDVIIITLPIPIIWSLSWDLKKKVGLSFVFLLGALTTAASVARTVVQYGVAQKKAKGNQDVLYYLAPIVYWPLIEAAVGIIAACLPLLRPLVRDLSMAKVQESLKRGFFSRFSASQRNSNDDHDRPSSGKSEQYTPPVLRDESGWLKVNQSPVLKETVHSRDLP